MNKLGLAAIISLAIGSSGCAVAVGAGAGVGAYHYITRDKSQKASETSMIYPAGKVTLVYTCGSEGSLCTEVYVDKRTDDLAKKPLWYEDGWMFSRFTKPDGQLDQVCRMNGDSADKGSCKLYENMKVKDAEKWQANFEEVKSAYARQK